MKNLLFILSLMLFASCDSDEKTLRVLHTGEKTKINTTLYNPGDTVVLRHTLGSGWIIDDNWIKFSETFTCLIADSLSSTCYYKAVILDPVVEYIEE